jgi:hypothetical protein
VKEKEGKGVRKGGRESQPLLHSTYKNSLEVDHVPIVKLTQETK